MGSLNFLYQSLLLSTSILNFRTIYGLAPTLIPDFIWFDFGLYLDWCGFKWAWWVKLSLIFFEQKSLKNECFLILLCLKTIPVLLRKRKQCLFVSFTIF